MIPLSGRKLILINPCVSYFFLSFLQRIVIRNCVPHSLLILAALTPKEYDVKIINLKPFWLGKDFTGDSLIGITCLTSTVSEAYRLADRFRKAGSKVVLGGPHVSVLSKEALEHADSVVIGEAESVWGQVLTDFESGHLQEVYKGQPLEDFFTPVYDYFMRLDPLLLSRSGVTIDRGCKYRCDFCARISPWLRFIRIEQALGLIKRMIAAKRRFAIGKPVIFFRGDNIYSSPSYAKELFKKLIPLKLRWGANCSIDIGFDEEALRLAKASGCHGLLIGFESIYPQDHRKTSLNQIHSMRDYRVIINKIRSYGIKITGSFIIGLDRYRHLDYLKLLWFIIRARLWSIILPVLTPLPGSELFSRLEKENRITSFDWRKYNFVFCVIKPKYVSVASIYTWLFIIRFMSVFFTQNLFQAYLIFIISYYLSRILIYRY